MRGLKGTGVALITPFDQENDIDFPALKKLLIHLSEGDVDYLVVMGTTGENATLRQGEKNQVLDFVIENNPKNLPIVFGIGGNNTEEVLATIVSTDLSKVSAILSVCPYYNKPSQEGIFQHFTTIADTSPVPVILYNVPSRTGGAGIKFETTLRLASHPNVIGIKEASGDMGIALSLAKNKPKDFLLISGDDMLTPALVAYGFEGVISVLANAFPREVSTMLNAALASDFQASREQLFFLEKFNEQMYRESNPVGLKELLSQLKLCSNRVRLPLVRASEHLAQDISSNL